MTLVKINNHIERAKQRLLEQYKYKTRIAGLIEAIAGELQEVENCAYDLYTKRSIFTAIGAQLDVIGVIVGLDRGDRNDEDYRDALFAQIQINISGGEAESIYAAIKKMTNATSAQIIEIYPASYQLFVQTKDVVTDKIVPLVNSMTAAGVGNIITVGPEDTPFRFGGAVTQIAEYAINPSGDKLEINNSGDFLEVTSVTSIVPKNAGGFGGIVLNQVFLDTGGGDLYAINDSDLLELQVADANEDYTLIDQGGKMGGVIV